MRLKQNAKNVNEVKENISLQLRKLNYKSSAMMHPSAHKSALRGFAGILRKYSGGRYHLFIVASCDVYLGLSLTNSACVKCASFKNALQFIKMHSGERFLWAMPFE